LIVILVFGRKAEINLGVEQVIVAHDGGEDEVMTREEDDDERQNAMIFCG
jgi:hypothetical protein